MMLKTNAFTYAIPLHGTTNQIALNASFTSSFGRLHGLRGVHRPA
jgi:hypothetical protein